MGYWFDFFYVICWLMQSSSSFLRKWGSTKLMILLSVVDIPSWDVCFPTALMTHWRRTQPSASSTTLARFPNNSSASLILVRSSQANVPRWSMVGLSLRPHLSHLSRKSFIRIWIILGLPCSPSKVSLYLPGVIFAEGIMILIQFLMS